MDLFDSNEYNDSGSEYSCDTECSTTLSVHKGEGVNRPSNTILKFLIDKLEITNSDELYFEFN
jgi:hypothetical protein